MTNGHLSKQAHYIYENQTSACQTKMKTTQSPRPERSNLKYKNAHSEVSLDIVHKLLLIDKLIKINNSSDGRE